MKKYLSTIITFLLFFNLTLSYAQQENVKELVKFGATTFKNGEDTFIVLNFENKPDWHTYWKNPGDAGTPFDFNFKIDGQELDLKSYTWPAPIRFVQDGDIWGYGYIKKYSFFFKIKPELIKQLKEQTLEIQATWLSCKHICIHQQKTIHFGPNESFKITFSDELIENHFNNLPLKRPLPTFIDLTLAKDPDLENGLILFYNMGQISKEKLAKERNILTPYPLDALTFKHEKLFYDKDNNLYGQLKIDWDGEYLEPPKLLNPNGQFSKDYELKFLFSNPKTQKVEIIKKTFSSFNLTSGRNLLDFFHTLKPVKFNIKHTSLPTEDEPLEAQTKESGNSLIYILILSFIGGLILNVMPCVLPIISLKLFSLIKYKDLGRSVILKHNIFYSLGIFLSFLALALVLLSLKMSSEGIGWGFQLQSPHFVAIMIIVLFIFALNLFEFFEFRTPGGKRLGNLQVKDGPLGSFLGGVIATILATPCSAPFLGVALTFAFSSSNLTFILIFLTIAFGLAFPFLLTGFFPSLISFLPKPGNWMNHLKKFLGLSLILTVIWLIDIFIAQTAPSGSITTLNITLTFLAFAFYLQKNITKNRLIILLFFLLPALFTAKLLIQDLSSLDGGQDQKQLYLEGPEWETWGVEIMESYKSSQETVFIDFTAKWCFTCKVNEKLVLNTDQFEKLVIKYNLKLLLADWTKRDAVIGKWLKAHGVVGVPAYFIQKPDGELIYLGETITISEIESYL